MKNFDFSYTKNNYKNKIYFRLHFDRNYKNYYMLKIKNISGGEDYNNSQEIFEILSTYCGIEVDELIKYLINNFTFTFHLNKLCFLESECDKIIDWLESFKIMNKLMEE